LTTWKNAPDGRILKSDTPIAKNYLDEKQMSSSKAISMRTTMISMKTEAKQTLR